MNDLMSLFCNRCGMLARATVLTSLAFTAAASPPVAAKNIAQAPAVPTYAHVADLATAASTVAVVQVKSIATVPPERAPGLKSGEARYYVEAESRSLIRGDSGLGRQVNFVIDGSPEKSLRPVTKKGDYIVFGSVDGRIDMLQLLSSDSILPWSKENEALTRKIVAELLAPNAPPPVTQIESAFYVAGVVKGEGETQIFLETANKQPISLSIIRRPDEQPLFNTALGEVVGDIAKMPTPNTLLWYRLACGLPADLPPDSVTGLSPSAAQSAQRDYADFMAALGACAR